MSHPVLPCPGLLLLRFLSLQLLLLVVVLSVAGSDCMGGSWSIPLLLCWLVLGLCLQEGQALWCFPHWISPFLCPLQTETRATGVERDTGVREQEHMGAQVGWGGRLVEGCERGR